MTTTQPLYLLHPCTPELRVHYPHATWIVYPGVRALLFGNKKDGASLLTMIDHGWGENVEERLAVAELQFLGGVRDE